MSQPCGEPGCTDEAVAQCEACEDWFCHRHLERGTGCDGDAHDLCFNCVGPPDTIEGCMTLHPLPQADRDRFNGE